MRRGEAISLDLADFDDINLCLYVRGKGHREKTRLTLPPNTRDTLAAWVEVRGREPGALLNPVDRWGYISVLHHLSGEGVRLICASLGAMQSWTGR